ncbi:MAG: MFS transporter [Treponema sp.]|jgi:predicted MFS family arabinose efflux permease|nr:MFS transporter [Treponema sp.]
MTNQKRALVAIYAISFVLMLQQFTGTTIAYIIASFPHLPPTSVQQIVSLPAIFGLIVSFLIGPLALKINKKYLTIFTAFSLLVYFAIFAFAGSKSITPLLVATVFAGVAQGGSITLVSSMIGEFVGAEKSAGYVAAGLAVVNGGGALMAIVGGAIAAGNGGSSWPQSYYLGFIIVPAIIVFGLLMPQKPETQAEVRHAQASGNAPSQASPAEKGKLPLRVFGIGILTIFSYVCICGFLFYVSVYIVNEYKLGTSVQVGLANSIFTITGIVTGFTYSFWAKIFKKALIVAAFSLIALALFCMMTFTTTLFGAFAAAALLGWGFNIMNPYAMGFIMGITPPRLAPVGISFFMAGMNMGMFIAIYMLNFLSDLLGGGIKNVLLICTVGMAACTVAAFFVYRKGSAPAQAAAATRDA